MSAPKDGGPAFPCAGPVRQEGMSLRDWFAGQALAGIGVWLPVGQHENPSYPEQRELRAAWAYRQADAMLAERVKDKP